jgi:hypothetical protein
MIIPSMVLIQFVRSIEEIIVICLYHDIHKIKFQN